MMNAAAPLRQSIADSIAQRVNCVVTQWYGMTEASPSVISQREDEAHIPGTIGKLLPGIELKIITEDGKGMYRTVETHAYSVLLSLILLSSAAILYFQSRRPLTSNAEAAPGEVGEYLIRGPNIMQGYVEHAAKSVPISQAFDRDGFFKTGDIGYIDQNGYCFLIDRAKEMIKVRGYVYLSPSHATSPFHSIPFPMKTQAQPHCPATKSRPPNSKPFSSRTPSSPTPPSAASTPTTARPRSRSPTSRRRRSTTAKRWRACCSSCERTWTAGWRGINS